MWIPKTEAEIVSAVQNHSLEETVIFDAKKEIPGKGIETAKDVSAFANTAGGVLLYGVDEDENGFPTVLSPILLEGQKERVEAIIRTSIEEVPVFKVSLIKMEADSSKGYLVIFVPPSERAPHMVVVKGDRRFYGRGESGNYVLSQTEVARLYERRGAAEQSILPILEENIRQSPIQEHDGFSHLHVVIKPVFQDQNMLDRARLPEQNHIQLLNTSLEKIILSDVFTVPYEPDFQVRRWIQSAEGFVSKISDPSVDKYERHTLYLEVNFDGSGSVFCSRAAETVKERDNEVKWFFSDIVAGTTIKFLALFSELYKKASYFGMVDIGVGLTRLEGSFEFVIRDSILGRKVRYEKSDYRRTKRASVMQLEENPKQIAADLLLPLINAVSQNKYNPFTDK